MKVVWIQSGEKGYPPDLPACFGTGAPDVLGAIGNIAVLDSHKTGLVCSEVCPGELILKTYDFVSTLRDEGSTVISGFHSPMEQECLHLLLRGEQPVIICPARSIENMRTKREWKEPLEQGRLLLLSPFDKKYRRVTATLAEQRNELVVALADRVVVPYARPGGKAEALCHKVIFWGKPLLTFDTEHNAHLIAMGARRM